MLSLNEPFHDLGRVTSVAMNSEAGPLPREQAEATRQRVSLETKPPPLPHLARSWLGLMSNARLTTALSICETQCIETNLGHQHRQRRDDIDGGIGEEPLRADPLGPDDAADVGADFVVFRAAVRSRSAGQGEPMQRQVSDLDQRCSATPLRHLTDGPIVNQIALLTAT